MVCKVKVTCDLCNSSISKNGFKKHREACNGVRYKPRFKGCRGGWNKGLTKETEPILAEWGKRYSERVANGEIICKGTPHTEEFKRLQSERAMARGLGGHTSKIRLKYELRDGTVVYLQSSYEIEFATLLDQMDIEWCRPDPLWYRGDDNKKHRYYPDFKIGDIYIDTKNDYLAIVDLPKIAAVKNQNGIDLRIVTKDKINKEYIASLV